MTEEIDESDELRQLRLETHALKARVAQLEEVLADLHLTVAKTLTYASKAAHVAVIFEFLGKEEGEAAWSALTPLGEEIDTRLVAGVRVIDNG